MNAPTERCLRDVTLDDKYVATEGRIYLSGIQALVRLPLVQRLRDQARGLRTAGFVSGYRGSPLGGLDESLWKAEAHLRRHDVHFVPGVNEELAATAVWGTQQVHLLGPSPYDGVFALWYGKGPGVDRCVDVFKHMNHAGTARHGGVLLVAGDDHGAYSSTLPHQSDPVFAACHIPVLYPCHVREYIELGLHGWALSRYAGCAVGFKALADTVESSASIEADPHAVRIVEPADLALPEGGLHNRPSNAPLGVQARTQEALLLEHRLRAVLAYARANGLNRVTLDAPRPRLGIAASGKSYQDVLEALGLLGIDGEDAARLGIRLFKVAMPWPLEPEGVRHFARGLEEILVVEEKRSLVEDQLKAQLYSLPDGERPRVVGKAESGTGAADTLPATGDLSVARIARAIAARAQPRVPEGDALRARIEERLALLAEQDLRLAQAARTPPRPAWYCSGCPHNTGTSVPEGGVALAGIGCHVMATAIYPESNRLTTQMGGEGAPWIGAAPFSERRHVYANLGDGTYYHSGLLAIRAAVAARRTIPLNITYKILYNDAVAMTGGQPVDGPTGVVPIARQVLAEGVDAVAIVSEAPERWRGAAGLPAGVRVHDRSAMEAVQRQLAGVAGVSVLIYDQTCAAEKRRRRRQGTLPEADERVVINPLVCEGCGDCGLASNCTSLLPLETPWGRKRMVDQSSCNQDLSCLRGFCPSFVTVRHVRAPGTPRGEDRPPLPAIDLPEPAVAAAPCGARAYNVLVTGIGGTGVITVGALLGMAAHLEGKEVSVLDMTGMSQKNGAVTSHVRISAHPDTPLAQRIPHGEADLLLGGDLLAAGAADTVARLRPGRTLALLNPHEQPTGAFTRDPDWRLPTEDVTRLIEAATAGRAVRLDATRLARVLCGNALYANLLLLGHALQLGRLPVSRAALERAIALNGVAVEANLRALHWGRLSAHDPAAVARAAAASMPVAVHPREPLATLVARHAHYLAEYQDEAYAARYRAFVARVEAAERRAGTGEALTRAVARHLARLMAYKDEYEVARLHLHPAFRHWLAAEFGENAVQAYHLAPPVLGGGPAPRKRRFGPWMSGVLHVLARLKRLRGTPFDPFGHTEERRTERALIGEYCAQVERTLENLSVRTLAHALAVAEAAQHIRGFGHVKQRGIAEARARWAELAARPHLADLLAPTVAEASPALA
jgi:indolepyruvate ferredoxin oxidoreductase